MIYRIVQYLQPWEIDDFEKQIEKIILSTFYINLKENTIIYDVTLNISDTIVNWDISILPKDYFTAKFNYICDKLSQYIQVEADTNINIQGCTDKRRSIENKTQDYIIWLDSDLFFPIITLPYLISSTKYINYENYILTPQIIKWWDNSWDCITNDRFLFKPFDYKDSFDLYSLDFLIKEDNIKLKINNTIKFGGGWFNLFTNNIFKLIPIPLELGSYASDDTYIMYCAPKLNIPQIILEEIIVTEIGNRYTKNKDFIKSYLNIKIKNRNRIPQNEFNNLVLNFHNTH